MTASMMLSVIAVMFDLMKLFKSSGLIVGRPEEIKTRTRLSSGWRFSDDDGIHPVCPNGHRCEIVGGRVVCAECGAVSDVVVETWSPRLRRFTRGSN
jgi:hypothetical protein